MHRTILAYADGVNKQVDEVTLARRGEQVAGTLHLTPHHIIFVHTPPQDIAAAAASSPSFSTSTSSLSSAPPPPPIRPRELWITYPIISFCTFKPAPSASRQRSSIRLRCRDFTFVCFYFKAESQARDVYDSLRAWTCQLGQIEKLYAFNYQPQSPEKDMDGWHIYDPGREWRRMGVGTVDSKANWRISQINQDYAVKMFLRL